MKVGIISDIHGNIEALQAVLREFEKRKVGKIICCGDIIGIGPSPDEVVQELIKQSDKLEAIRGNHEQYLINGLPERVHDDKRKMSLEEIENHKWISNQLSDVSKKFLYQLPLIKNIKLENKYIHIVHYPMNEDGGYKIHIKNATLEENKEMFCNEKADIFLFGHTHTTNVNNNNGIWYINPGSVGCPMNGDFAFAGILSIDEGKISYKILDVVYDVQSVVNEIRRKKYPAHTGMIDIFFGGR